MSKKNRDRKDAPAPQASHPLFESIARGDNAGARAKARAILADPAASPEDKAVAEHVLTSTRPDRAGLAIGVAGLILIAVIVALLYLV